MSSCPHCLRNLGDAPGASCPHCAKALPPRPAPPTKRRSIRTPQPRLRLDGFERIELIGRGGMGAVYRAQQTKLRRRVALKVLDPRLVAKPGFQERFEREAATGARVRHPNAVRFYDLLQGTNYDSEGRSSVAHVICMEYVDGPTLKDLLARWGAPVAGEDPKPRLRIFRQICAGVAAVHEAGIVHRDLKPENIMLDSESGRIKVTDYGLAYFVDRSSEDQAWDTKTSMRMGTPAYMPPEQHRDAKRVAPDGDVYALGRILYEMVCGFLPDGAFAPASTINPALPQGIDAVIEGCLRPAPEDRYRDARGLLQAFDGLMTPERAPRPKPSAGPVPPEPSPLHPILGSVPLSALIAAPVLIAFIVGWWFASPPAAPAQLVLDGRSRAFRPSGALPQYPIAEGGLWSMEGSDVVHAAKAGELVVIQSVEAKAVGLSDSAQSVSRRIDWARDGAEELRNGSPEGKTRWVGVGFRDQRGDHWVGIDAAGDCFVHSRGDSQPCGLGRRVVSPARIELKAGEQGTELRVDRGEPLGLKLPTPSGSPQLLLICQNQRCRFGREEAP